MANYQPRFWQQEQEEFEYVFRGDVAHGVEPYIFTEPILIAIDVALVTRRPLLVAGKPGCGKSRLADAVAALLGWNFLERTMTSRTRPEELTVEIDHLRRLHDAQSKGSTAMPPDAVYRNPGVFWWAFEPDSATVRGCSEAVLRRHRVRLDYPGIRRRRPGEIQHTVLLIDEIDKAEPDVPNDLLEPLDVASFSLPDGKSVCAPADQKRLTIITTNGERALPPAFLRRCVSLVVDEPSRAQLIAIAEAHEPTANTDLVSAIADKIERFRDKASTHGRTPGTSEFLDAIRACVALEITVDDAEDSVWTQVQKSILQKTTEV